MRHPPERGIVLHHFVGRIATEKPEDMNDSQTTEPEGGEHSSPPPLPGRSAPLSAQELAEVFIALAFGDVTEEQVNNILGLPMPPGFLKTARANGTATVKFRLSKRAESGTPKGWSDPGNTKIADA